MRSVLCEPKKEGVIKDWILQTILTFAAENKENNFHDAVLFRGDTENEYYCLHSCPHRTHTETFCY